VYIVTTKISPGMLKMFSSASSAPVSPRHRRLSSPAFGPASITQAKAPRNGGVTKEASTSERTTPRPGTSVRAVSQASGAPMAIERSPTQNAITTVFQTARRRAWSPRTAR
jgi:hypothetical protein